MKIESEVHGTVQIVGPGGPIIPEQIFPFLSNLIWVALIAVVIFIYRRHIRTFLSVVNQRLKEGAPLEFSYFKLGIAPQTPTQQRQKLETEITQAVQDDVAFQAPIMSRDALTARYLTAEDLALREIQTEFGVPLSRQIQASGVTFDAVFTLNSVVYLVEVKLVRSEKNVRVADTSIRRFANSIGSLNWKDPRGLLVVVFDNPDVDLPEQRHRLMLATVLLSVPIDVRCYRLSELIAKYGAVTE